MTRRRRTVSRFLWLAVAASAVRLGAADAQGLAVRPAAPFVMQAGDSTPVALLAYNAGGAALSTTLRLSLAGGEVSPDAVSIALEPKAWQVVAARVSLADSADRGELVCEAGESSARIGVIRGIDLTALPWKRTFSAPTASPDPHYAAPGTDDTSWPEIRVPGLWDDTAYAWCRTQVSIPQQWQGHPLRLVMGAVDDNDITYLNGREIGRTTGWNVPREYLVPEDIIRWGEENIVTVMVDNTYAGGGLYKAPIALLVGDVSLPTVPAPRGAAARPQPGSIGNPLPLRCFRAEQGVLRYPEGTEVALWGVNYYPQSWHQFENMQKLGADMKATIRADLDHLQRMGVEAIRIHVFDREISDGAGNLVPNEHLDLLDYLVAECSRRGIYMYFTPIAWWGGPNERRDSFSAQTSKPGMMFVPTAKGAAANYLRQFLMHENTYSGRAYKDEPCLCLLEVQNEPAYFAYGDLSGASYGAQGEPAEVLERDRRILRDLWRAWLDEHGFDDSAVYFPFFRYGLMREYIREMVGAIRSTGATQPVAISYFGVNGDDLVDAIADSQCDAITVSAYPGGWGRVNDGVNLLPQAGPLALDSRLNGKARLAYEFDTPATNTSCYLFPALAAHFRSGEVQVACQFQYDSVATARWNTDWGAHWLNWLYTPSKTVSFMIGGETFRRLPRGVRYEVGGEDLKIGPMVTSFQHNISLFATVDTVMHSRAVQDWMPLRFPERPSRIIGVGASPYVEYGGTGLYVLERQGPNVWRLTLNPDARLVGNSLQGSFASPVAELEENRHWFRLKLPGWDGAECYRLSGRNRVPIAAVHGGWLLRPGTYEIRR